MKDMVMMIAALAAMGLFAGVVFSAVVLSWPDRSWGRRRR